MEDFCGDVEAATEQLYDELMARTWAIHRVVGAPATDVSRPDVAANVAAVALRHVRAVPAHGTNAALAIGQLLWPHGAPPAAIDAWWATPLGQLLAEHVDQRRANASGRNATLEQLAS